MENLWWENSSSVCFLNGMIKMIKYRDNFTVGEFSVENPSLIQNDHIVLPGLHLNIGIFKQFIKYLKNEAALLTLSTVFP